VPLHHQAV